MLTQKRLKEVLNYDSATGIFTWKIDISGVKKDDTAGCIGNDYIRISIDGRLYLAQRLSFLYMKGYFPEHDCDHINRRKCDNRWCNIREVSRQCNLRNTGNPSHNTSGVKGVSFSSARGKWESNIHIDGKKINLGRHGDFMEAVCHRLAAEQVEDWSGCDSSSPAFRFVQDHLNRQKLP